MKRANSSDVRVTDAGSAPQPDRRSARRHSLVASLLLAVAALTVATPSTAGAQTPTTYSTPVSTNLNQTAVYLVTVSSVDGSLEVLTSGATALFGFPASDECDTRDDDCFRSTGVARDTVLGFTGTGAQVSAALLSLTFTPNDGVVLADATITVDTTLNPDTSRSLAYNAVTKTFYEFIVSTNISWFEAFKQSTTNTLTVSGTSFTGYLATITSLQESEFVATRVSAENVWFGATDDFRVINRVLGADTFSGQNAGATPSEGEWYWISGPEAGTRFYSGCATAGGGPVNSAFNAWITGIEPNNFQNSGCEVITFPEPTVTSRTADPSTWDEMLGEHYAMVNYGSRSPSSNWNDFPATGGSSGYLVEYGPLDTAVLSQVSSTIEWSLPDLLARPSAAPTPPVLTCTPDPVVPGGTVTCEITGGPADSAILWNASFNGPFAGAGVMLDAGGRGTFTFVAPRAAAGQSLSVVLVDWTRPISVAVTGQVLPSSLPAGEGTGGMPIPALLLMLGLTAGAVWRLRSGSLTQAG